MTDQEPLQSQSRLVRPGSDQSAHSGGSFFGQGLTKLFRQTAKKAVIHRIDQLRKGAITLVDQESELLLGNSSEKSQWHAHIRVLDSRFYSLCVQQGSLGFAQGYLDGYWETDDLTKLLQIFVRDISITHTKPTLTQRVLTPLKRVAHGLKQNTKIGSRKNIAAHYDLGNELFELFLDPTMTYSCGIFEHQDSSLHEASLAKLDRICKKLDLNPSDHVLEIGTGWGSFAIHAAKNYGCRVTTTTISKEQHALASKRVREAGLENQITLLLEDYRDLEGQYDKLVSIEMIEAVGHKFLDTYFGSCSNLLKPDGQMLIQAITMPDQRYQKYLRTVDFIQHFVFPGSCCPSPKAISDSVARATNLRSVHLEDLTPHYPTTLGHWRTKFMESIDTVQALGYPKRFERLWEYYLCYCQAGFNERYIGTVQIMFNKPECRTQSILPSIRESVQKQTAERVS
ncbi:MAG: class I SAM-dependent methyltransferase [Phycisphaerales bacterium]